MKIRTGFVSNSSSSSFVCDSCGEKQIGMDLVLSEAGMVRCVNNHVFCESHVINLDEAIEENDDYPDEISEKYCPFCSLKEVTDRDLICYLLRKLDWNRKHAASVINKEFKGNYKDFRDWVVRNI